MKRVKSLHTDTVNRCGQDLTPNAYYTLQNFEVTRWANDDSVLSDIALGKLVINNGDSDISGVAEQINFLKDLDDAPANLDGRRIVHATPRKIGTYAYYTGSGDCDEEPLNVGGDEDDLACMHHSVGDPTTQALYVDFNTIANESHIFSGFIQWLNAKNDHIDFEFVPQVTPYAAGTNTTFNLYNGYLIVPAAGNGTISVNPADIKLVQCVPNEFGAKPAGFWNASFNASTQSFENLTPAPLGNGGFNIFAAEVVLSRFVNKFMMLGEGNFVLPSTDITQVPHGARLKATAHTHETDHEWWWSANIIMYRKKTC